jgi:hypothetical protein
MHRLALCTALALAAPPTTAAQANGTVGVRAVLSTVPLAIVSTSPLDFGPVLPGIATSVNPRTGLNAGEFAVQGLRRADFTATFTLPTELAVGPYTMPIVFGAQSGCQDKDTRGACKFFDPRVPFTGQIANRAAPQNTFFFWLGGTVTPAAGQQPGFYRGTITLQVAYTGA